VGDLGPITLNKTTIRSLLDGGQGVRDYLVEDANRVLDQARSLAPVGSGDYQASLHIADYHTDRLVINVISTLPYARQVEREHSVLSKALGASQGEIVRRRI